MTWTYNKDGSTAVTATPGAILADWDGYEPPHLIGQGGAVAATTLDIGFEEPYIQLSDQSSRNEYLKRKHETSRKIAGNLQKALIDSFEGETAERVGACGSYLAMEAGCCGDHKAVRFKCGHKLCPNCAGWRRWKYVRDLSPLVQSYKKPRFLTLTFINVPAITPEYFKWMNGCWKTFLKSWYELPVKQGRKKVGGRTFADMLGGGIRATEITYNTISKTWHPHFHVIFDGEYLDERNKSKVSDAWEKITTPDEPFEFRIAAGHPRLLNRLKKGGEVADAWSDGTWDYVKMRKGASIVDVRSVDEHPKFKHLPTAQRRERGLRELIKYITKLYYFMEDAELIQEFLGAAYRHRMIITFGTSYNFKAPKPDAQKQENWNVDPFNHRGLENVPCRCGGGLWNVVGLMSKAEAGEFVKNTAAFDPDPPPF